MVATTGGHDARQVMAAEDAAGGSAEALENALSTVIAERAREFRRQLALTVGQLAELTGLSRGMVSKIENAQASPSLATLARLSEALTVPVTAFFRGINDEQDVLVVQPGRGSRHIADVAHVQDRQVTGDEQHEEHVHDQVDGHRPCEYVEAAEVM
jgi:transcriptional regulator with XRE-family HTH domain